MAAPISQTTLSSASSNAAASRASASAASSTSVSSSAAPHQKQKHQQQQQQYLRGLLEMLHTIPPKREEIMHKLQFLITETTAENVPMQLQQIVEVKEVFIKLIKYNPLFHAVNITKWILDVLYQLLCPENHLTLSSYQFIPGNDLSDNIRRYTSDNFLKNLLIILSECINSMPKNKEWIVVNMIFHFYLQFNPVFDWLWAYTSLLAPLTSCEKMLNYVEQQMSENSIVLNSLKNIESYPIILSMQHIFEFVSYVNTSMLSDSIMHCISLIVQQDSNSTFFVLQFILFLMYNNTDLADSLLLSFINSQLLDRLMHSLFDWISNTNAPNVTALFKYISIVLLNSKNGFYITRMIIDSALKSNSNSQNQSILEQFFRNYDFHCRQSYLAYLTSQSDTPRIYIDSINQLKPLYELAKSTGRDSSKTLLSSLLNTLLIGSIICNKSTYSIEKLSDLVCELFLSNTDDELANRLLLIGNSRFNNLPTKIIKFIISDHTNKPSNYIEMMMSDANFVENFIIICSKVISNDTKNFYKVREFFIKNLKFIPIERKDLLNSICKLFENHHDMHLSFDDFSLYTEISQSVCHKVLQMIYTDPEADMLRSRHVKNFLKQIKEQAVNDLLYPQLLKDLIYSIILNKQSESDEDHISARHAKALDTPGLISRKLFILKFLLTIAHYQKFNDSEFCSIISQLIRFTLVEIFSGNLEPDFRILELYNVKSRCELSDLDSKIQRHDLLVLPELTPYNVLHNTNITIFVMIKQNPLLLNYIEILSETFSSFWEVNILANTVCWHLILYALFSFEKKLNILNKSSHCMLIIDILKHVLVILRNLYGDDIPYFMHQITSLLPFVSSHDASLILSDMYNFLRKKISKNDAKYRLNSILQNNITDLSNFYYLMADG